ncbi:MAG TPA: hypothetical protein VIW46_01115 [Acidimicrobiia bacterium]|jgi:hypothetical protein
MAIQLPDGLHHVRTTAAFDRDPPGLLATHRIASNVWGRLLVHGGSITSIEFHRRAEAG